MKLANYNAQRLAIYRQRLGEGGFKRISAYVSLELIAFLQSEKCEGECLRRPLERLLLGGAKACPHYYSDDEIAAKQARRRKFAMERTQQTWKATRSELRALSRAEWERLRLSATGSCQLYKTIVFTPIRPHVRGMVKARLVWCAFDVSICWHLLACLKPYGRLGRELHE